MIATSEMIAKSPIMVSQTAKLTGYNATIYQRVVGLTQDEKEHLAAGGIVIFKTSQPNRDGGTCWRRVKPYACWVYKFNQGCCSWQKERLSSRFNYVPRLATRAEVEATGNKF